MHHRVAAAIERGGQHDAGRLGVGAEHGLGLAWVEAEDRGGVDDRVAALEGVGHRAGVEHVAGDHVVRGEGHPVRVERLGHLLRAAYDEPDVVAVSQQGQRDVRADVPGSTRDQNAHA